MESKFLGKQSKPVVRVEDVDRYVNEEIIYIDDFHEKKIDVSRFLQLRSLGGYYKQMVNLNKVLTLESLMLWRYENKKNEISHLINLEELSLIEGGIIDLTLLSPLKKLERIELSYLSKLVDITDLCSLSNSLTVLEIDNCKKIDQIDLTLKELKQLRVLKIIGLDLKDISFVKCLPNLQQLIIIGSNVLKGDISPAENISYVGIDNKRHYNYKFDDATMKIVRK